MKCRKCGAELIDGASFCMMCGSRIAKECPKCGTELPEIAKFCFKCGAEVPGNASDQTVASAVKTVKTKQTDQPFFSDLKKLKPIDIAKLEESLGMRRGALTGAIAEKPVEKEQAGQSFFSEKTLKELAQIKEESEPKGMPSWDTTDDGRCDCAIGECDCDGSIWS